MPTVRYHDWLWAGGIVATVQAGCGAVIHFFEHSPDSLQNVLASIMALPGGILVLLFHLDNIHNVGKWEFLVAIGLTWILYTSILQWVIRVLRRRREKLHPAS